MRQQLIRKAIRWQAIGLASGAAGSVVMGAVLGLVAPAGSWPKSIATGAVINLGAYLSTFFIWLPTTVLLIAGLIALLARYPDLAHSKPQFVVGLTALTLGVAFFLRFAVVPFGLTLLFGFLWVTLVPPLFFLDLRMGGSAPER
jgi:hypothetical protein